MRWEAQIQPSCSTETVSKLNWKWFLFLVDISDVDGKTFSNSNVEPYSCIKINSTIRSALVS
jgi:hypothetical protein